MGRGISRDAHQTLACQRGHRLLGEAVDVGRRFVPVVLAAQLDRLLRGLGERHAAPTTLPRDPLVGHVVVLRPASEHLGGDLLQLPARVHACRVRRAGHGVGRLTAARNAGPGKIARRVAPADVHLLPGNTKHLGGDTMAVEDGFRPMVADARLDRQSAIRFDDAEAIKSCRAREEHAR